MNTSPMTAIFLVLAAMLCNTIAVADTITVSSVPEFLAALGSDRTILLQPGAYDLSQASPIGGDYYRWECGFGKQALHIMATEHLTIASASRKQASIISSMPYGELIIFEACGQLSLRDLKIIRKDRKPDCPGVPLRFLNCNDLQLSNVKICSERIGGVTMQSCNNVRLEAVFLYHAHEMALEIQHCDLMMFAQCKFAVNEGHSLVHISSSKTIQFHSCAFISNFTPSDSQPSYLFNVVRSNDVGVFGGILMHNEADYLSNSSIVPSFDRVQFKQDNVWRRGKFAK